MPSKPKPTASNRVKPTSSAAKVRMADNKMTKAANAKAPRNPRGQQGYGMDTSKGSVTVRSGPNSNPDSTSGRMSTGVYAVASGKKAANSLLKTAMNSKAAGLKGMGKKKLVAKQNDSGDFGVYNSKPTTIRYREYESKNQPKVTVKKKK